VRRITWVLGAVVVVAGVVSGSAMAGEQRQQVVIRCAGSCDRLAASVQSLGGEVTYQFQNVDALTARIPQSALPKLAAIAGEDAIKKDTVVSLPPHNAAAVEEAAGVATTDLAGAVSAVPADFSFNNALINVASLHAQGLQGQGTIVAVIDSGVTNSSAVAAISGSVVGGETLVPTSGTGADPVVSATSRYNGPHGTWVGTTIAGHALFIFANTSNAVKGLLRYAPDSIIPCSPAYGAACTSTRYVIPVIGSAPAAQLYAVKVFPSNSDSAPNSRITAAMDRVLTIRRNYNAGVPSTPVSGDGTENNPYKYDSLKIDVVNLSLGGPTLISGDDVQDLLTRKLVEAGITVVVSAGNDGSGAMTVGSPGSGTGAVTVAAASSATHERILREAQYAAAYGAGIGAIYRPFDGLQTADFSSRGPTADGQIGPDVSANGLATFAQGTCTTTCTSAGFSWVSGTSFSSPTTAGVAAVLRSAVPTAKASQVRNAIILSANPSAFGDKSGRIDRGAGLVDAQAALTKLQTEIVPSWVPDNFPLPFVWLNIARTGYFPILFINDRFKTHVNKLLPGQVAQFFVPTDKYTDRFDVAITKVSPADPAVQNQLFGEDLFVSVLDAPTSYKAKLFEGYVATDTTIPVENPQSGLARVAIAGDTTNAGAISADLVITRHRAPLARETAEAVVQQGDEIPVKFRVPAGTKELVCELFWEQDWGRYPTNDIDLVLLSPDAAAAPNYDGATLASPERVVVTDPLAGDWTAVVQAFTIHPPALGHGRAKDAFTLRVTVDGKRVKVVK
jgi:subtilisin family serine protease